MFALPSIFVAYDRVHITSGPFHGFSGTVLSVPAPGKLQLSIDGFSELNRFVVSDGDVEPCKDGDCPDASESPLPIFTPR